MCTTTARRPANRTPILFAYDESGGGVEMNDPGPCPTCQGERGWYVSGGEAVPLCPMCHRYGDAPVIGDGIGPHPHNRLYDAFSSALNCLRVMTGDTRRYGAVQPSILALTYVIELHILGQATDPHGEWLMSIPPPGPKPTRRRASATA